jgi:GT2 family glycosyltransferase
MSFTTPKMSIVIPVFNQVHLTRRCLTSLLDGAKVPHQLIIINNGSVDETGRYLEEKKSEAEKLGWDFKIITNLKNVGVGAAFNQGIKASSGEFITLANNDTWLMPGWDKGLLTAGLTLNADMVGAYYDETPFDEVLTLKKAQTFVARNKGKASRDWAAIVMMYRKSTFEKIGTFDERYFVAYEDRDVRERMDRAGLKYYKTADCFIWHHSKGTRDADKTIGPNYEQESLAKFIAKWGFDPRPLDNKWILRQRRKFAKFKNKFGLF